MSKLRIKVSGCMRSMTGAEIFCTIRSYLATARHGIGALDALTRAAMDDPWIPEIRVTTWRGPACPTAVTHRSPVITAAERPIQLHWGLPGAADIAKVLDNRALTRLTCIRL